jgi:hypothetical protein
MRQSNTSQIVIKHHAKHGHFISLETITDEQRLEEWKHKPLA